MIYLSTINIYFVFDKLYNSIYNILSNKYDCKFITNINEAELCDGDVLIVTPQFCYNYLSENLKKYKIRIIIINTEPIFLFKERLDILNICNHISSFSSLYVLIIDYSLNNISYFNDNNKNDKLKIIYNPFTYNSYIENLFIKKSMVKKDIDIYFYGYQLPRRKYILDQFKQKGLNVLIGYHNSNNGFNEQLNCMNRSKIIINIYQDEKNAIFDFYRFTPLLSGKFFFITESYNLNEDNLIKESVKYIVTASYEKLVETTMHYLNNYSVDELQLIADNAYNWYKSINDYENNWNKIISSYNATHIESQQTPSVNLIIATYGGKYYKFNNNLTSSIKENFLKYLLICINNIKTNVTQITIMKPKIDEHNEIIDDYYNFDNLDLNNIKIKIKIVDCDNFGISYGQYIKSIELDKNFDYFIFLEDDYIPFTDYFEKDLITEYERNKELHNNQFLCLAVLNNSVNNALENIFKNSELCKKELSSNKCYVADFSLGIMSIETYKTLLKTFNFEKLYSFFKEKLPANFLYQILFSKILCESNIQITDIKLNYLNLFYCSHSKEIKTCNDTIIDHNLKLPLFIPIDLLFPSTICNLNIDNLLIKIKNKEFFIEKLEYFKSLILNHTII